MGNILFFDWEVQFMVWLQSFESSFLTSLAVGFTMLGEEKLMILILGIVYWCVDSKLGRKVALSVTGTMIFGALIKSVFLRRRPYMDNAEIKCIRAADPKEDIMSITQQGYSMPSLHAAMSAATYGSLARETRKKSLIILAIFIPLFIGLSRNYLGVHYPTDVIAGWIIGTISMILLGTIANKKGYKAGFIVVLAVGAIGFFYCRDNEFYTAYGINLGLFLGFIFEEKLVNFEKSKTFLSYILRPILGLCIFAVFGTVLKLPVKLFSDDTNEMILLVYRTIRYTLSTFIIIGPYPMLFKKVKFL